ncbi:hypothetical protein ATKI12_6923 [Kitasatospora sp. Ki12]
MPRCHGGGPRPAGQRVLRRPAGDGRAGRVFAERYLPTVTADTAGTSRPSGR